jgi:hypothetical protein
MSSSATLSQSLTALTEIFLPHCADATTLRELRVLIGNRDDWESAHGLFQRIRKKTLDAERVNDTLRSAQYQFEEACAKTIYNVSGSPAPFDPDAPFWVIPNAISLAGRLGLSQIEVTSCVVV